jgi:hypothetical protein
MRTFERDSPRDSTRIPLHPSGDVLTISGGAFRNYCVALRESASPLLTDYDPSENRTENSSSATPTRFASCAGVSRSKSPPRERRMACQRRYRVNRVADLNLLAVAVRSIHLENFSIRIFTDLL